MKTLSKRAASLMLALALLTSVFAGLTLAADAAADYNSGVQGKVCTSLSSSAKAYYGTGYDYETLSQLSGTALEAKLRERMASGYNGTYSYSSLGTLFKHTDSYNGNTSKMRCFYSSSSISSTMNREHVWPKSLAPSFGEGGEDTGTGGADVLHLRPADATVNSTRSNKAFGSVRGGTYYTAYTKAGAVGGYYNAGYFEPLDAVKGDVARIILYVYTRWQERNLSKVFQSSDLLLQWCEQDPVDEYEMQRNDICQQYVSSRNIYVDYPEYCWRVFNKPIPTHMTTPSGKAKTCFSPAYSSAVTKPATCTQDGVMTYTCANCGYSYTEAIPATGHHYQGGVCVDCGAVQPTGEQYVLTNTLQSGDKILIFNTGYKRVLSVEATSYNGKAQVASVSGSVSGDILKPSGTAFATLTVSTRSVSGVTQYAFKNQSGKYLACETANELSWIGSASATAYWIVEDSGSGTFYIKNATTKYNGYSDQYLEVISSSFTTYGFSADKPNAFAMQLYKLTDFGTPEPPDPPQPSNPFEDVPADSWFYDPVLWAVENGITGGLDATHFGPNKNCTRAQVVTFLYSAAGKPAMEEAVDNPFVDVSESAYYYTPVLWAFSKGITGGIDATHFGPSKNCTRAQVVTFLWTYHGRPYPSSSSNPFSDVPATAYYTNAVLWAVEKGVTGGTGGGKFSPNKVCTRAQIVTFLRSDSKNS